MSKKIFIKTLRKNIFIRKCQTGCLKMYTKFFECLPLNNSTKSFDDTIKQWPSLNCYFYDCRYFKLIFEHLDGDFLKSNKKNQTPYWITAMLLHFCLAGWGRRARINYQCALYFTLCLWINTNRTERMTLIERDKFSRLRQSMHDKKSSVRIQITDKHVEIHLKYWTLSRIIRFELEFYEERGNFSANCVKIRMKNWNCDNFHEKIWY